MKYNCTVTADVQNVILLGGNRFKPINHDVSQVNIVTILHAQSAVARYTDASSTSSALGLYFKLVPLLSPCVHSEPSHIVTWMSHLLT